MAPDPAFSTELALAHLKSVDARTAHLDAQAVVDRGAIRRAGMAALGALAALALGCSPQGGRPMGPPPGQMVDLEAKKFITAPGVGGLDGFSQAVVVIGHVEVKVRPVRVP